MNRIAATALVALVLAASAGGQTVTVVAPNGGESWALGASRAITWSGGTTPGSTETVKLSLIQGTAVVGIIAENLQAASSSYSWTVGHYIGGTAQAGSNYKVQIQYTSGPGADTSNSFFSIIAGPSATPTPSTSLRVTSPNGGESWRIGTERTISWTSTNVAGKVKLELVREPSTVVGLIATNLQVSGNRVWKAGEFQGGTANAGEYRVRVTSLTQPTLSDASDQPFSLTRLQASRESSPRELRSQVIAIPATNKNWVGTDSFPSGVSQLPKDILQTRQGCSGGANQWAQVGRDWFAWNTVQIAELYRSQVVFNISPYKPRAAELKSAKLRFTQAEVKRINTDKVTALSAICELSAPWTSFTPSGCGNWRYPVKYTEEFTVDVTDTARKWLDGSLANNGLLLWAREAPMSTTWTLISCYDVSLELEF